jgi:hypothetical protein
MLSRGPQTPGREGQGQLHALLRIRTSFDEVGGASSFHYAELQ